MVPHVSAKTGTEINRPASILQKWSADGPQGPGAPVLKTGTCRAMAGRRALRSGTARCTSPLARAGRGAPYARPPPPPPRRFRARPVLRQPLRLVLRQPGVGFHQASRHVGGAGVALECLVALVQ